MKRIEAVVFDLDGLLIDSESLSAKCWRSAGEALGFTIKDEVCVKMLGMNETDADQVLLSELGSDLTVRKVRRSWREGVSSAIGSGALNVLPGALELIQRLRDHNLPFALATSSSTKMVEMKLASSGLAGEFEAIAAGDEIQNGKPAPDIFLKAAELIGIEPVNCLVFEDSPQGVEAAHRAGMSCIMVPSLQSPSAKTRERCLTTLSSLNDAIPFMEQIGVLSARGALRR